MNETQQIDWEKYLQENGQSQEQIDLKINKLFFKAFCEKHNISRVTALFDSLTDFDGLSDSEQMDNYVCFRDGKKMDIPTDKTEMIKYNYKLVDGKRIKVFEKVEKPFYSLIDLFTYTILNSLYPEWQINEGGFGEIIINKDGTGKVLYNEREITYSYSYYENNF